MEKIEHPLKILALELDARIIQGSKLPPQDGWVVESGWMSVFYAWEEEWNAYLVTRTIDYGIDPYMFPHYFPVTS